MKRYRLENVTVVKPEPGTSGTCDGGAGSRTDSFSRKDILSLMNMPKVELQIFSGDPLHYHEFIQTFDHNVYKVCSDGDLKLTRLMQYTAGPAKQAIRGCQLIGGEKGYDQANKVLEERFAMRTWWRSG